MNFQLVREELCLGSIPSYFPGNIYNVPFACDSVGYIMSKAWKARFLERMNEFVNPNNNLLSKQARLVLNLHREQKVWVTKFAAQGGSPSVIDWNSGFIDILSLIEHQL
eukprot:Pgem_evm1s13906